jgi:hypothetical protein
MIGSMFSYGARVRELISAFAEANEAMMASDPRSRARVLGKRATDMLNGYRRHPLREANAVFSTACTLKGPAASDFHTAKLRRGVPGVPATRSNARRLQTIATY